MIVGIEVLCEACGTELEVIDVNTDHLLRVTLKTRSCSKCSRPPDCQLFCEDVLEKEKELIAFREQVARLEKDSIDFQAELLEERKKIGVLQERIKMLSSLIPIDEEFEEDDEDTNKPDCYGHYKDKTLNQDMHQDCNRCAWQVPCINKK